MDLNFRMRICVTRLTTISIPGRWGRTRAVQCTSTVLMTRSMSRWKVDSRDLPIRTLFEVITITVAVEIVWFRAENIRTVGAVRRLQAVWFSPPCSSVQQSVIRIVPNCTVCTCLVLVRCSIIVLNHQCWSIMGRFVRHVVCAHHPICDKTTGCTCLLFDKAILSTPSLQQYQDEENSPAEGTYSKLS